MKYSFNDWLSLKEGGNDVTSSYIGGHPTSAQFAIDDPIRNPSLPWQMNMFRNWYNTSRGKWAEVEKAAQINPAVKHFLQQAMQKLVQAPQQPQKPRENPYADNPEFDLEAPNLTGTLADDLQQLVKAIVPQHGSEFQPDWKVPSAFIQRAKNDPSSRQAQMSLPVLWAGQQELKHRVDRIDQKLGIVA